MNINSLPDICSEKDVAQLLLVAPSTIRSMCKNGEITHRKIRNHYRIMKEDLIEYLEEVKCQRETGENSSNGGLKGRSGKSSGLNRVRGNGSQLAQISALKLIKNSRSTKKERNAGQIHV